MNFKSNAVNVCSQVCSMKDINNCVNTFSERSLSYLERALVVSKDHEKHVLRICPEINILI